MVDSLNTDQYSYKDLHLLINGLPQVTVQSVTLQRVVNRIPVRTHKREVEFHKVGNTSYTGELTMLHSSFAFMTLPGIDLTDASFLLNIALKKGSFFITYNVIGCHFTSWSMTYSQGDLNGIISLPFVARNMVAVNNPRI